MKMEGIISSFRRGRKTQKTNQVIVTLKDSKESKQLVGKKVSWKSPAGKEIKGKVAATHGNKGCVRVLFEKGIPGQAIGSKVIFS